MTEQVKNCYLGIGGKKHGPVSEADILKLYNSGKITGETKFIRTGMKEWIALSESDILVPSVDDDGLPPLPIDDGVLTLPSSDNKRTLENIKKFDSNKECRCLECGYNGLMGIVRNKMNPSLAVLSGVGFAIIMFFVFSVVFFFLMEVVIGAGLDDTLITVFIILIALAVMGWTINLIRDMSSKKVLLCPNCEKEIIEK